MAGKAHPDKEKITYGEWKSIRAEILKAAGEENITEPEMLRKVTLLFANQYRRRNGKPPLKLEYRSSNAGGRAPQNEPPPLKWDRRKKKYLPVSKLKKAA